MNKAFSQNLYLKIRVYISNSDLPLAMWLSIVNLNYAMNLEIACLSIFIVLFWWKSSFESQTLL